jgi:hypothetical protein
MRCRLIGLLITLTLGLLVAPLAADAQPPGQVYWIGFLSTDPPLAHRWEALLDGLRERGYREGHNLVFERRFSEGHAEHFPELAAELVRLRVDCIIVTRVRRHWFAHLMSCCYPLPASAMMRCSMGVKGGTPQWPSSTTLPG